MSLQRPTGLETSEDTPQTIQINTSTWNTPAQCRENIRLIIEAIKEHFQKPTFHNLTFEVHGQRESIRRCMRHGIATNTYNIPQFFYFISEQLTPEERYLLRQAFPNSRGQPHGTAPDHETALIMLGIGYYLHNDF